MDMIEIYEFPGKVISLQLPFDRSDLITDRITRTALDAVASLIGNNFIPTCADLWLGPFDRELLFPLSDIPELNSTWLFGINGTDHHQGCGPVWEGQQHTPMDDLTITALEAAIRRIISDRNATLDSQEILSWKIIGFRGIKAKIVESGTEILRMKWLNKELEYPIQTRDSFQFMPDPPPHTGIPAPIEIELANNGATITLSITLFWSYWTDKTQKGTRIIADGIRQLTENNWILMNPDILTP
jgi:hypothetical protein